MFSASMNYITRRVLIAALVALVTSVVHKCARAQSLQTLISPSGSVGLQYGAASVKFIDRSPLTALMERKITLGAASEGAAVAERYGLTLGGNAIEAVATRAATNPGIAVAAVALGGAAWAGWTVGSAIARALDMGPTSTERIKIDGGKWMFDSGKVAQNEETYCAEQADARGRGTQVCNIDQGTAALSFMRTNFPPQSYTGRCTEDEPPHTISFSLSVGQVYAGSYVQVMMTSSCGGGAQLYDVVYVALMQVPICHPRDENGAELPPAPPGFDGRCASGMYQPADDKNVQDAIVRGLKKTPALAPLLAIDILQKGGGIQASPREVTGPTTVTGQPQSTTTTTTGPDGQPATTTTTTTPTTKYTYGGDTINYNTTNVTVTNNGGNTTTTTTTTSGGGSQADPAEDPCNSNPDRVGCMTAGDPPSDEPQWESKDIPFAAVDMPSGSCPPDRYFTFHTWALPLHYQPACDAAPIVKIGMLLCASITAIAIITSAATK